MTIGTYISELVPKQIRGRAFACEQAVGFLSVPVVAFLSYLLVPRRPFGIDGWRWVVLIGAHGAVFVWFIRRALPESPRWLAHKGRLAEADRVLSKLEANVAREYGKPLPAPAPPVPVAASGRFRDMWVAPYGKRAPDDDRLQHLPDGRLLRLCQLGADAAHQAGHYRHHQPDVLLRSSPWLRQSGR